MDPGRLNRAIEHFPLEAYLQARNARPIKGRKEWELMCPGCGKDKLIVNAAKHAWHCWVCESKGSGRGGLLDLMELLDGVTRAQAVNAVLSGYHDAFGLGTIGLELQQERVQAKTLRPITMPPYWRQGIIDNGSPLPYCRYRGISESDADIFGLGWCSEGRYGGRLVFPVFEQGQLVYWQARAMWEKDQHIGPGKFVKSLNPSRHSDDEAVSSDVLFNLDTAARYPRVCITEGPIDAIRVGPDAVCTFGKRLFPAQIAKLIRAGVTAIDLMWDGPGPTEPMGAWVEAWQAAMQLQGIFDTRVILIPRGDPADHTREQLAQIRVQCARQVGATRGGLGWLE